MSKASYAPSPVLRATKALRAVFVAILVAALMPLAAAADEYRLGSMDKLRIRVVEWQTAEGTVRDWSSISGDYMVGPAGEISLPFIGQVTASGRTTAEIAEEIGEGLQQKFGLVDRPEASVEVAEFRPIFVSGDVQTPGKYAYGPNLTVLKAVALAGGIRRAADLGQRVERDFINARGNYEVLEKQRDGLLARRARLLAEASAAADIAVPAELRESPDRDKLMTDEKAFKAARENRLKVQLDALDDLKSLLQNEIVSLEKKIATQNRQIELARKELDGIDRLAQQGLVVNQRVLTLERTIAELESKVLDMETQALRAKQDISKATQDAANLRSERETDIAQERQQTETEIAQINLKIAMYRDLMGEAVSRAPDVALTANLQDAALRYTIVRVVDGKNTEQAVDENAAVLPGDVIKVKIEGVPVR